MSESIFNSDVKISPLLPKDALLPWNRRLIGEFETATAERLAGAHGDRMPAGAFAWFVERTGFVWIQVQGHEDGGNVLRVHALYLKPGLSRSDSQALTRLFEEFLTTVARLRGIREIGFYTRREPAAMIRRLNRTAPFPWKLDSYVITRGVD